LTRFASDPYSGTLHQVSVRASLSTRR